MKKLVLFLCALVLSACATKLTPHNQLEDAVGMVSAYVEMTRISLQRGRITPEQASKALVTAKKARDGLQQARIILAGCAPEVTCTDYVTFFQSLQPTLFELERELRAKEAK